MKGLVSELFGWSCVWVCVYRLQTKRRTWFIRNETSFEFWLICLDLYFLMFTMNSDTLLWCFLFTISVLLLFFVCFALVLEIDNIWYKQHNINFNQNWWCCRSVKLLKKLNWDKQQCSSNPLIILLPSIYIIILSTWSSYLYGPLSFSFKTAMSCSTCTYIPTPNTRTRGL